MGSAKETESVKDLVLVMVLAMDVPLDSASDEQLVSDAEKAMALDGQKVWVSAPVLDVETVSASDAEMVLELVPEPDVLVLAAPVLVLA